MTKEPTPYTPGMMLMPGESTRVSIPVRFPDGASVGWALKQVAPPEKAPVQALADRLGLCAGLRAEESKSSFRCSDCFRIQPSGSTMVWVPDGVCRGDPAWSVTEAARRNAYNGHASGWCLRCAAKLSKGVTAEPTTAQQKRPGFWGRLFSWM